VHKLTLVPAGCAYREWHETGATTRVTFLYSNPAAFRKSEDGECRLQPRIYFEDSFVWETASKLRSAIEGGKVNSMPYLEALSGVLAHELSRVHQGVAREPPVSRGGLASWRKQVVVDYIEEHLGKQVCLLKVRGISEA